MTARKRPLLTRAKKEEKIWILHEEGFSISEITKEVGVSATTASTVIKRCEKLLIPKEKSKRSQALILYGAGAPVRSVAIEIDVPVNEAEEYLIEFHKAEQLDYLEDLRVKLGPRFPQFVSLARELADRDMTLNEMDEAIYCTNKNQEQQERSDELASRHHLLQNQVRALKLVKANLSAEKGRLDHEICELKESLDLASSEYRTATLNIQAKKRQADNIDKLIDSKIEASDVCLAIEKSTYMQIKSLLKNERAELIIIISAMAHVISTDRSKQFHTLLYRSNPSLDFQLTMKLKTLVSETYNRLASVIQNNERREIYEAVRQIVEEQSRNKLQH